MILVIVTENTDRMIEKADSAVKFALNLPRIKVEVPYTDFKRVVNQFYLSTWQDDWNGAIANKLHSATPVPGVGSPVCSAGRITLPCVVSATVIHI